MQLSSWIEIEAISEVAPTAKLVVKNIQDQYDTWHFFVVLGDLFPCLIDRASPRFGIDIRWFESFRMIRSLY